MRSLLASFALLSAFFVPAAAHASTFTVTGSGAGVSGSGVITANDNGNGSFTITGLTASGGGVSGITPTVLAPNTFNGNDNLFFPASATLVDSHGFAFQATQGNTTFQIDIFSPSAGTYSAFYHDNDGLTQTIPITMSLVTNAAVPEPSSLMLLGTGIAGAALFLRRKLRVA